MDKTRRRLLTGLATSSIVPLAGCSGDSSSEGSSGDDGSEENENRISDATPPSQKVAKLVATNPNKNARFGTSVSMAGDGETVVIGAPGKNVGESGSGAAYIFQQPGRNWREEPRLTPSERLIPSDPEQGKNFGISVAMSANGETAVIGESDGIHIFELREDNWQRQIKIVEDETSVYPLSGGSVNISRDGNTAIVPGGAGAYVFERDDISWIYEVQLNAGLTGGPPKLDWDVNISRDGEMAFIREDGGALIFERDGLHWQQQDSITGLEDIDSVVMSNDGGTAMIGRGDPDQDTGEVIVYEGGSNNWQEQARLAPEDLSVQDEFGSSIGLSYAGGIAVIGAQAQHAWEPGVGAAYVFEKTSDGWQQRTKFRPPDDTDVGGGRLGSSVGISDDGSSAVVGAGGTNHKGAGYIYK